MDINDPSDEELNRLAERYVKEANERTHSYEGFFGGPDKNEETPDIVEPAKELNDASRRKLRGAFASPASTQKKKFSRAKMKVNIGVTNARGPLWDQLMQMWAYAHKTSPEAIHNSIFPGTKKVPDSSQAKQIKGPN